MNYSYYYWKKEDEEKPKKSKKYQKNIMLETEIARENEFKTLKSNDGIFDNFKNSENSKETINHVNFRENIQISIEKKMNKRDLMEKRLNKRTILNKTNQNPFLSQETYLRDIDNQENYLRPKCTDTIM
tara:strand:+ start:473 stop:859 length:387 start_codon:yes stop_codon:yes gene_type:complete